MIKAAKTTKAQRQQAERLTEATGEGLMIVRADGRRERVRGGKLVPVEEKSDEEAGD